MNDNFKKITEIRKAFGLKVEVADRQINVEELIASLLEKKKHSPNTSNY